MFEREFETWPYLLKPELVKRRVGLSFYSQRHYEAKWGAIRIRKYLFWQREVVRSWTDPTKKDSHPEFERLPLLLKRSEVIRLTGLSGDLIDTLRREKTLTVFYPTNKYCFFKRESLRLLCGIPKPPQTQVWDGYKIEKFENLPPLLKRDFVHIVLGVSKKVVDQMRRSKTIRVKKACNGYAQFYRDDLCQFLNAT